MTWDWRGREASWRSMMCATWRDQAPTFASVVLGRGARDSLRGKLNGRTTHVLKSEP